jgi:NAD(P)-dependent dehydrogenase (short-subunit alcohol dehydrogenase family)
MELRLSGKTAIVTGGSEGIGLACAKALFAEGVHVLITGRDVNRLQKGIEAIKMSTSADKQQNVLFVAGDLSQKSTAEKIVDTALSHFGKIDILINNAGSARAGAFFDLGDEAFLEAWNLKLLGYIRMIKQVAPSMIEQRDGRIVNIIGTAGRTPTPTFLPGSTANAALLNFTKGISKELARHNVRINAISPSVTSTERAERLAKQNAEAKRITVEEQKAEVSAAIPLGHMVNPDEIAAMALLLVSDLLPSITGSEIVIDGGQQPGI